MPLNANFNFFFLAIVCLPNLLFTVSAQFPYTLLTQNALFIIYRAIRSDYSEHASFHLKTVYWHFLDQWEISQTNGIGNICGLVM